MSPLERSSRFAAQGINQIGGNIADSINTNKLEQQQGDLEAFTAQALSGDPVALKELMVRDPERAQYVAQQLQQQKQAGLDDDARFQGEIAMNTADFIEQMHTAPIEQQQAMFEAAIDDPRYDIDEEDRNTFMDTNARKAIIGRVKGNDYAENFFGGKKEQGFTLGKGEKRFDSTGKEIAAVAPDIEQVKIPDILLEGLSENLAPKASAAYSAAGGGKDGMVAYQKQVDKGTEQEKRLSSPAILKSNFPQASAAEMAQLQGTMDAAKTTESGLQAASKVRDEQRRLVKAKGFQQRAVELLTSIINSPDVSDVTGSIEGAYDLRLFSDDESSLIADIEEAGNILTADNLSLMSGVLSESDIKILKNLAGGALIRTRSEDRFTKDVTTMRDKLKSQIVMTANDRANTKTPKEGATATNKSGQKAIFTNGVWVIQNGQ